MLSLPFTVLSSSFSGVASSIVFSSSTTFSGLGASGEPFRFLVSIKGAPILGVLAIPSWTTPEQTLKVIRSERFMDSSNGNFTAVVSIQKMQQKMFKTLRSINIFGSKFQFKPQNLNFDLEICVVKSSLHNSTIYTHQWKDQCASCWHPLKWPSFVLVRPSMNWYDRPQVLDSC